jgi:twinkle protein
MGKVVIKNRPCLNVDCGSSDARQIYEDGTSFCFSCSKFFPKQDGEEVVGEPEETFSRVKKLKQFSTISIAEIKELPQRGFKERDIEKKITEFYGVRVSYNSDGEIDSHYYPYGDEAYKIRKLPKQFFWEGPKTHKLFGQDKFSSGGKRLTIAEGEIDTLSIAQATYDRYKQMYPVVGIASSTMTKHLLENRDWIRSFNEVVLCFDNDKPGQEATQEAIRIIGFDKVKIAKIPEKDANDVLLKHGSQVLLNCIFNAEKYVPSGIIGKEQLWKALTDYNKIPSTPYPPCVSGLNDKLKGMRSGEITLLISGTGSGKSTLLREIMLHILETTEDKIGVVSLEESPAETARKLAAMKLARNPANEEISLEELKPAFDSVFGDDRVIVLDHQGSIDDSSIIDSLEYMCLTGCRYLFIDHITILVSEGVEALRGNEAIDKVMNDLLRLVKRHPVWVGLVSHLRKAHVGGKSFEEGRMPSVDDIRGSGSIKQVSFDIISFARNSQAKSDVEKNTMKISVLKSRFTGLTGQVRSARYIYETGRIVPSEHDFDEEFTSIE